MSRLLTTRSRIARVRWHPATGTPMLWTPYCVSAPHCTLYSHHIEPAAVSRLVPVALTSVARRPANDSRVTRSACYSRPVQGHDVVSLITVATGRALRALI